MSPDTDWRQKVDHGCQGLCTYSRYMEPSGAYRHSHQAQGPFCHPMDAIRHKRDISRAWTTFILDNSNGFTKAGVERLNDSIRTYVWAIRGAQSQTRSNILKAGTGFDAQKQFLSTMPLPLPSTSRRASHASRKRCSMQQPRPPPHVDRLWIGLYLAPSDMELHLGTFQGYNNEVRIAVSDAGISHNPGINESEPIGPGAGTTGGKIAPPAGTVHRGPQADVPSAVPEEHVSSSSMGTKTAPSSAAEQQQRRKQVAAHEEEKALVTAGIVLGLLALWRR